MIGTDSHTPNAGGLGMAAIGVGGAGKYFSTSTVITFDNLTYKCFRRCRCLCRPAMGAEGTQGPWRAFDWQALGMDRAQRYHPEGRWNPHRQGRDWLNR